MQIPCVFSQKNGEIAVLLVDFGAECDKPQHEEPQNQSPANHLPVVQMFQKGFGIFEDFHAHEEDKETGDEERDADVRREWKIFYEAIDIVPGCVIYFKSSTYQTQNQLKPVPDDDINGTGGSTAF